MFLQHCTYSKTIALLIAIAPQLAFSQTLVSESLPGKTPVIAETANLPVTDTAKGDEQGNLSGKFGKAANVQDLGKLRGGAEVVVGNDQKLKGTVADNSATNVSTGSNNITSGAFANVSGIPIVVQNSGANVLIQNSTIINLQLH